MQVRSRFHLGWAWLAFSGAAWFSAYACAAEPTTLDFGRDIRPILSNNCLFCHGPDDQERKGGGPGGLRFDVAESAFADLGDGRRAIVPGDPDKSELLARVTTDDADLVMPPKSLGKRLTAKEVATLREWIKQGAPFSQHWAYVKPRRPEVPAVRNNTWPRTPIDRFLLARLERESLTPMPEADRFTLLRRLSLDLTGLPPTAEDVQRFVNSTDPQAYEREVDRLLAAPAFGEHWAHFWLDLARYADSAGYADDPPRKIWLYRDYVIAALNDNRPFDQFTIEQIAGDLLPNATEAQKVATAFHRNTLTNNEGGTNDEEFRNVAVVDRVNTTLAVWMGTTMACAQCHNHKYDPISQEDYFKVFAILNNSADADRGDESPLFRQFTPSQREDRQRLQQQLADHRAAMDTAAATLTEPFAEWQKNFPLNLAWTNLTPTRVESDAQRQAEILPDNAVLLKQTVAQERLSVEFSPPAGHYRALRLEALTHPDLPGHGPGHATGNFILGSLTATIEPQRAQPRTARFVRIELPGQDRFLHLAEVEVFSQQENVARKGQASQSTTGFDGPAALAIDGNTNGDYAAKSVTHTAEGDPNPWWEVDLLAPRPVDRVVVWNRTDNQTSDRTTNFRVVLLDDTRKVVWDQVHGPAPKPSAEFSTSGQRTVTFQVAIADHAQPGFSADAVLKNPDPKLQGWAVGDRVGQPHQLTLIAPQAFEIPADAKLIVNLGQQSNYVNHVLGHFRLSLSADARVEEWARTPAAVLQALAVALEKRSPADKDTLWRYFLSVTPALATQRQQIDAVEKQLAAIVPETVPVMEELPDAQRRITRIQMRGNFLDLGKEVSPGTPTTFHPLRTDLPPRLALAHWLVDPENPLTARVIANRYWEQLFGIGIVATSEEFGSQGDLPMHPELLDWLATEMLRLKWDTKAFLKQLVMSAAYRQSSKVSPNLASRDPDNRLLARGPRFRLSAEMIRDQSLFAAGLLSRKMYGPPVKPPQPSIGLAAAFGSGIDWQTSTGEDRYRRGLYTTWRRSNPYPSMATFDAPNREVCTLRRVRTNTPLQALVTLNDPVYIEAAQGLARRVLTEGGNTTSDRAGFAIRTVLIRPAQPAELQRLTSLYDQALAHFNSHPDDATKMATQPLGPLPTGLATNEAAAWTVVANIILNLDEALMKP